MYRLPAQPCLTSPSVRRAWIEIRPWCTGRLCPRVALRTEGVDRNSSLVYRSIVPSSSPSVRRAWIEMRRLQSPRRRKGVALRTEGVDRNRDSTGDGLARLTSPSVRRAWIEIRCAATTGKNACVSPSVRRAWIEIRKPQIFQILLFVALRTEGVDRNERLSKSSKSICWSPSVRRAWIEIPRGSLIITLPFRRPPYGGRG